MEHSVSGKDEMGRVVAEVAGIGVLFALSAVYLIIGSVHEETRLLDRYGDAYRRYQREVPFLFPRPGRKING